jgi:hypothetical protein
MPPGTILFIILILLLIGVINTWPHSRRWGFAPGNNRGRADHRPCTAADRPDAESSDDRH